MFWQSEKFGEVKFSRCSLVDSQTVKFIRRVFMSRPIAWHGMARDKDAPIFQLLQRGGRLLYTINKR